MGLEERVAGLGFGVLAEGFKVVGLRLWGCISLDLDTPYSWAKSIIVILLKGLVTIIPSRALKHFSNVVE